MAPLGLHRTTPDWLALEPNSPPRLNCSAAGAGELGLSLPGNGSAQPRCGPGLEPRLRLYTSARMGRTTSWQTPPDAH